MNLNAPAAPDQWDPAHYLTFADQRLRPALDLLARVPLDRAGRVVDLGCGPGNVVPYLAARFADARIEAVDSSAEMLDAAMTGHGAAATWVHGNAATWAPERPCDLIYSNATLHWLDDHAALFPRLMGFVKPGGVLAVQMPKQFAEPSHVLMREAALDGPWAQTLKPLLREAPVARAEDYYDWLAAFCDGIDIWETAYAQVMNGDDPVLDWISSTALKPLLEALPDKQRGPFRGVLAAKLRAAYPKRSDGTTLFSFKRLFIVATRGGR